MTKLKSYAKKIVQVVLSPELKPTEVKLLRAAGAALLAYLGVKYA